MKKAALILLAFVVAASGCTGQDVATKDDLNEQTMDINQHTSEVEKQENRPLTKYTVKEIDSKGLCSNSGHSESYPDISLASVQLFELAGDDIQEYESGKKLVVNGIEEVKPRIDCHNRTHEVYQVELDSVSFEKEIYQNGSLIANSTEQCTLYEDADVEKDRPKIYDFADYMAPKIYEECFGVNAEFGGTE